MNKLQSSELKTQNSQLKFVSHLPFSVLLLCLSVILNSCDQSFDPIKESTSTPVSMYGYLDASVDTQWVRITPIRYQIEQTLVKPETHVEIEHLQSEMKEVMNDSLFQFRQGFNAINAFTTMDIEPGEIYQLKASRPDGATSRVTVTLPERFPEPIFSDIGDGCRGLLRIEGVPRLVDVQSRWQIEVSFLNAEQEVVLTQNESRGISYISKAGRLASGAYEIFIDTGDELSEIFSDLSTTGAIYRVKVISRNIFIASAGPEWNEGIRDLDDIEYVLPEGTSNVENGLGYMFGIVSRSFSYLPSDRCFAQIKE